MALAITQCASTGLARSERVGRAYLYLWYTQTCLSDSLCISFQLISEVHVRLLIVCQTCWGLILWCQRAGQRAGQLWGCFREGNGLSEKENAQRKWLSQLNYNVAHSFNKDADIVWCFVISTSCQQITNKILCPCFTTISDYLYIFWIVLFP